MLEKTREKIAGWWNRKKNRGRESLERNAGENCLRELLERIAEGKKEDIAKVKCGRNRKKNRGMLSTREN